MPGSTAAQHVLARDGGGFAAVAHLELAQNVGDVALHGADADDKGRGGEFKPINVPSSLLTITDEVLADIPTNT